MRALVFHDDKTDLALTSEMLRQENWIFRNTGGVSHNNRDHGFHPAFRDMATGHVYLSRFANGSPAPVHLLEGLPDDLVLHRNTQGRIIAIKQTVIAGFVRAERFFTREQAALFVP
jgi:hypothetical protein